jgi:hypothetical protein
MFQRAFREFEPGTARFEDPQLEHCTDVAQDAR